MPEIAQRFTRIQRVNTTRGTVEELQCPLDSELLVAELAGELPPAVTRAVRQHLATCETCGARSRALRSPYELLAALGREPVPYVPDLRDVVRGDAARGRLSRSLGHVASAIGRGGALGAAAMIGISTLVGLIVFGVIYASGSASVTRSANRLANVPAAAAHGRLFAQTDKIVTVSDSAGRAWPVAEVIAVDEKTGAVTHSLPASGDNLRVARAGEAPAALSVSADGSTIFEITAPNSSRQQALIAIEVNSGHVRYAVPLALPSGARAVSLALAPGGSVVYAGLNLPAPDQPRVLALDAETGGMLTTLAPGLATSIPMPPPPGSLPVSAFPDAAPRLDAGGMHVTLGADGEIALSPDGQWLFDVLLLQSDKGAHYAVVRRFDVTSGQEAQALALPGDFTLARLTAGGGGDQPRVFLVKGSPDAQAFVLDGSTQGPTLAGVIALGGPASPQNVTFSGTLRASASADGSRLYITQNASAENGLISGHDLWVVDAQGMGMVAHRVDADAAGDVLANIPGGQQARIFILRGGTILLIGPDLTGDPVAWLSLGDGHPVLRLVATI